MNEKQARKRIKELKDYYAHVTSFLAVNLFLFAINIITTGTDVLWFVFPLLGWGIGLAIHTHAVFWTSHDWEARKLEELTGLKSARDDIQRLSERTEALVTIMSSVNWENIDPALTDTRANLEKTRQKIARLQQSGDPESQAEIQLEIEKLEAFVTSAKFDYYDRAAKDAPRQN